MKKFSINVRSTEDILGPDFAQNENEIVRHIAREIFRECQRAAEIGAQVRAKHTKWRHKMLYWSVVFFVCLTICAVIDTLVPWFFYLCFVFGVLFAFTLCYGVFKKPKYPPL